MNCRGGVRAQIRIGSATSEKIWANRTVSTFRTCPMTPSAAARSPAMRAADILLRLLLAGGLAVDAYVHANLAGDFDAVQGTISQGNLFRIEAAVASLVALLALLLPRRRLLYVIGAVVAGSALGAVLLYRYVNVGALGPIPNMYEPVWYYQKSLSAVAEAVALAAAASGVVIAQLMKRKRVSGGARA